MPNAQAINMSASAAATRHSHNASSHNTPGPVTYAVTPNENDFNANGQSIPAGVTPIDAGPFPGFEIDAYN